MGEGQLSRFAVSVLPWGLSVCFLSCLVLVLSSEALFLVRINQKTQCHPYVMRFLVYSHSALLLGHQSQFVLSRVRVQYNFSSP